MSVEAKMIGALPTTSTQPRYIHYDNPGTNAESCTALHSPFQHMFGVQGLWSKLRTNLRHWHGWPTAKSFFTQARTSRSTRSQTFAASPGIRHPMAKAFAIPTATGSCMCGRGDGQFNSGLAQGGTMKCRYAGRQGGRAARPDTTSTLKKSHQCTCDMGHAALAWPRR